MQERVTTGNTADAKNGARDIPAAILVRDLACENDCVGRGIVLASKPVIDS
jgi:hypothetical protein